MTFRSHFRDDPSLDKAGRPLLTLKRQLQAYTNDDPPEKYQKALPLRVLKAIARNKATPKNEDIGELVTGNFFFAMRSCEHLLVRSPGKAKRLVCGDIQFFGRNKPIKHNDPNLYDRSETVAIIFRNHKNSDKMTTVTQHKNGTDFCPVRAFSSIIRRIQSYKNTSKHSPINLCRSSNKLSLITAAEVFRQIRATETVFGKANLGFDASEVGTHSLRSSTAMQLFLNKIPTYQIMLLGRWSSDTFLKYISRQVQEFSSGLSEVMIQKEFFTTPEVEQVQEDDLRTRNTASFATTAASGTTTRGARYPHPAIHTW